MRRRLRPSPGLPEELVDVERALRLVYLAILPQVREDMDSGRLGYAAPSYNREYTRGPDLYQEIAEQTGTPIGQVILDDINSRMSKWKLIERQYLEDAAVELASYVLKMNAPIREVVLLKAHGYGWKQIVKALPKRVLYSMSDDYILGLRHVYKDKNDIIRRLLHS